MADMSGLREHIQQWTGAVMVDAGERIYAATVAAAPERTGALRQQIQVTPPEMDSNVARMTISCDVPYAGYTDAGTQAHIIEARPGGVLAFYWEKVGRNVAFRFVNHPGTKGTQWFNGGTDGGEPMLSRWTDALTLAAGEVS